MYSIADYLHMVNDDIRTGQYINALKSLVNPDSVVLDIGTGPGIFALMACRFGARHVYAVEPEDSIQIARELARNNGFNDRITFIQAFSNKITLPEPATIIISDLRGTTPFFDNHINTIIDARNRFLSPDGILIPAQDILRAALVESSGIYQDYFSVNTTEKYNIDMQPTYQWVRNRPLFRKLYSDEKMIVRPATWGTLDYYTIDKPNMTGSVSWEIENESVAHGIRLWFDCQLTDGIGFTTAPDHPKTIYKNMFLPWPEPVMLAQGDKVDIALQAHLLEGDYLWRWHSRISAAGNTKNIKSEFRQSSFNSFPVSPQQLHKTAASHIADLNEEGILDHSILTMMKKGFALEEIARQIYPDFPDRFTDWQQALNYVSKLSMKYSK